MISPSCLFARRPSLVLSIPCEMNFAEQSDNAKLAPLVCHKLKPSVDDQGVNYLSYGVPPRDHSKTELIPVPLAPIPLEPNLCGGIRLPKLLVTLQNLPEDQTDSVANYLFAKVPPLLNQSDVRREIQPYYKQLGRWTVLLITQTGEGRGEYDKKISELSERLCRIWDEDNELEKALEVLVWQITMECKGQSVTHNPERLKDVKPCKKFVEHKFTKQVVKGLVERSLSVPDNVDFMLLDDDQVTSARSFVALPNIWNRRRSKVTNGIVVEKLVEAGNASSSRPVCVQTLRFWL